MKTVNENWKKLFESNLNEEEMLQVRGGGGEEGEDPVAPIVK